MTICDIFDALTAADRPYKKAMPVERAIILLHEDAEASKLDSNLVELFTKEIVPGIKIGH